MKKYILVILSVMLILNSASCTLKKDLPVNITIEGKEYQRAFVGELYPINEEFLNSEGTKKFGTSYLKYSETQFNCYVAYDNNKEPNIYFESNQFEESISYYESEDNFNFFCLLGNIHDENYQQIFEIKDIDYLMLDQLLEFSKDNDYNPFTSFNNEEGLTTVSIPDPNDWMAEEIHFYKESKDGAFSTSRGYTFILYENKLCLLYQYNFSDEKSPVMLIRYVPTEISDYFCSLLEDLQGK